MAPEVIMAGERPVRVAGMIGKDDAAHVGERPVRVADMIGKDGDAAHRFSSSVYTSDAAVTQQSAIALKA